MACEFPDISWEVTLRRKEIPIKDRVCPGWVSNACKAVPAFSISL